MSSNGQQVASPLSKEEVEKEARERLSYEDKVLLEQARARKARDEAEAKAKKAETDRRDRDERVAKEVYNHLQRREREARSASKARFVNTLAAIGGVAVAIAPLVAAAFADGAYTRSKERGIDGETDES